jgi:hypothetical protein
VCCGAVAGAGCTQLPRGKSAACFSSCADALLAAARSPPFDPRCCRVGGAAEPGSASPALRTTPPQQGDTPPFRAAPAGAAPPLPPPPLPPLPPPASSLPWDSLCSPRSAPTFSDGTRVSLQDAFSPAGAGEPVQVWWDGTVTGRATSGRTDFLGRPVYRVFFDDLEIQYRSACVSRVCLCYVETLRPCAS